MAVLDVFGVVEEEDEVHDEGAENAEELVLFAERVLLFVYLPVDLVIGVHCFQI